MLQDFAAKDMIEQIVLLETITDSGRVDLLPGLMDLYAMPLADQAVDEMVYHTLFALLAQDHDALCQGLHHPSERVRLVAIRRAGEDRVRPALPLLRACLTTTVAAETLAAIVNALGQFDDPDLTVDLTPFLDHDDDAVAASAMHGLVALRAESGREALQGFVVRQAEIATAVNGCALKTAQAISCLANYEDGRAAAFLAPYLHHPLPSFRLAVASAMATMGPAVLPALTRCLKDGRPDERILAAHVLGWSGLEEGTAILRQALNHAGLDANLKFAIYEALGRMATAASIDALLAGLAEEDEWVLLAVVTSLNDLKSPAIVGQLSQVLAASGDQPQRLLSTLVTARAAALFEALFAAGHDDLLLRAVMAADDRQTIDFFRARIAALDLPGASFAAARLEAREVALTGSGKRLLAAENSKAMRSFYQGVAAELGLELIAAGNGQKALDALHQTGPVDLLLLEMHLSRLDGVALTTEVRRMPQWAGVPILMVTTASEADHLEYARQAGVSEVLLKPFAKAELKATLARLLGMDEAASEGEGVGDSL